MVTDVLYIIDTDIFVKIMLFVTLEEQEAVLQFSLLFVVMTAFWVLGSVNCTAFRRIMYHLSLLLYHPDNLKKIKKNK